MASSHWAFPLDVVEWKCSFYKQKLLLHTASNELSPKVLWCKNMKIWIGEQKETQVGLSSRLCESVCFLWEAFPMQPSWCSPQRPYLNHKCLSFLNRSQVLVSWGILGPIKAHWQWLSPLGPPQGSAPLLTSPLLPSYSSNGSAPGFWLVST